MIGNTVALQEDTQALHRKAMELAVEASFEQAAGNVARAQELSKSALDLERNAANLLEQHLDFEPTRSVLFRSAASLAIDCGQFREAERLIARGLVGNPPPEIASELRDLFEQVNLDRHLYLRGVTLGEGEFQMSLMGDAVGFGLVDSEVFLRRVQDVERLIHRTVDRRTNRPFIERARRSKDLPVYLSVPRAASFAVTFRLGHPSQPYLSTLNPADSVVKELLECIETLNSGELQALEKRIQNPAYRRNFLGLIRRIAPDGNEVRAIGFTASLQGSEKRVILDRMVGEFAPRADHPTSEKDSEVRIEGMLKFADATKKERDQIGIVDENGVTHKLHVQEGMMDDIVRPLWDSRVQIKGRRKANRIVLEDITTLDDGSSL